MTKFLVQSIQLVKYVCLHTQQVESFANSCTVKTFENALESAVKTILYTEWYFVLDVSCGTTPGKRTHGESQQLPEQKMENEM